MTYHILHLTTPDTFLYTEYGLLFCESNDGTVNKIAIQDLKALVVATHGVKFTNNCLAKLLENDVIILHCNNKYQPTGWSLPLERIVRSKVFQNQIEQNPEFEKKLWKIILQGKIYNQAETLDLIGVKEHNLYKLIERPLISEGNIARQYWSKYFTHIGNPMNREYKCADTYENGCLNYGYAIIKTLIYRSVIVHGLIAGLGIHHSSKYKSTPLVYDLMEPYRPFVDYYFYQFTVKESKSYENNDFKAWSKFIADSIKNYRLIINDYSYKIVDTVDIYIEKIAEAYLTFDTSKVYIPQVKKQYLHIDKHRNREYEE